MMRHFDLHCDTLARCQKEKSELLQNEFDISLERGQIFDEWVQVFAAFVHDDYRGVKAYRHFLSQVQLLKATIDQSEKIVSYDPKNVQKGVCNAILSVENGAALGGKLDRISEFAELGVRLFSLVWNGENELAGGVDSEMGL
ncbi:MAG: membrane dipeptidase, partial [Oscillospiraceae bacterium]